MKEKFAAKYNPGAEIHGEDWLHLHRNENLLIGTEWTVDAARQLIAQAALASYPNANSDTLRAALAELYGVKPKNIFVGNGSDEVLADLFHLLRHSYERMGVLDVCFKIFLLLAERYGYQLEILPGNTFATGQIAVEGWQGLAVVDSPNAITSATVASETLQALAKNEKSFVIWDNAYGEFAGDVVPQQIQQNVVIVRTFSKFYGLAGLRIGYCIADEALIAEMLARKDAFNVNSLAQVMALEALRRRKEFEAICGRLLECRQALVERLKNFGFKTHEPGGNFVLATHPQLSAEWLQNELMQQHIAVRRFDSKLTANHIRITVPPMAAVERLTVALDKILNMKV
ncbi:MAG: Histidinol-phosphate aminotransferase [bacterium]|nr:Histidinol-phosphate aminotransferase [bacterium]